MWLTIRVQDYPVQGFKGTKSLVISTVSWIGGKNPFLGWAYVVAAAIFVLLAIAGTIRHLFKPRYVVPFRANSRLIVLQTSGRHVPSFLESIETGMSTSDPNGIQTRPILYTGFRFSRVIQRSDLLIVIFIVGNLCVRYNVPGCCWGAPIGTESVKRQPRCRSSKMATTPKTIMTHFAKVL